MHGGEQQSGDEGEMIDEEAELRLISLPTSGAVKRKGKEEDIGRGKECCFGKEGAGEQAEREHRLEYRGKPGKKKRKGKSRRGDIACGGVHIEELEARRHDENSGENDTAGENGCRLPQRCWWFETHRLAPC
jgi:hypothetical protein